MLHCREAQVASIDAHIGQGKATDADTSLGADTDRRDDSDCRRLASRSLICKDCRLNAFTLDAPDLELQIRPRNKQGAGSGHVLERAVAGSPSAHGWSREKASGRCGVCPYRAGTMLRISLRLCPGQGTGGGHQASGQIAREACERASQGLSLDDFRTKRRSPSPLSGSRAGDLFAPRAASQLRSAEAQAKCPESKCQRGRLRHRHRGTPQRDVDVSQ